MLKRAIMVGCNSAGVNVDDLEVATVPVMRHQIRNTSSQGGVTVRLAEDDPQSVVIRFFDAEGLDIDEDAQRKIERMYHREDFRRVLAPEIGDIGFPARAVEQYTADLVGVDPGPRRAGSGSSWSSTSPTGRPASSCPMSWPSSAPTSWS